MKQSQVRLQFLLCVVCWLRNGAAETPLLSQCISTCRKTTLHPVTHLRLCLAGCDHPDHFCPTVTLPVQREQSGKYLFYIGNGLLNYRCSQIWKFHIYQKAFIVCLELLLYRKYCFWPTLLPKDFSYMKLYFSVFITIFKSFLQWFPVQIVTGDGPGRTWTWVYSECMMENSQKINRNIMLEKRRKW